MIFGLSTGACQQWRDISWHLSVEYCQQFSPQAIELNCSEPRRVQTLHEYIDELPSFSYVSLHAPELQEDLTQLTALSEKVDCIVIHADWVDDQQLGALNGLGDKLAIENMDHSKATGQTAQQMSDIFAALPQARFVLDVAHSHQIDPTDHLARELLDAFHSRLAHVHCSVIDEQGAHHRSEADDLDWQLPILSECHRPIIWEERPRLNQQLIDSLCTADD